LRQASAEVPAFEASGPDSSKRRFRLSDLESGHIFDRKSSALAA